MENKNCTSGNFKYYCSVSMTEKEAQLFYWLRQYEEIFKKAFNELKPGSLVLHFNETGKIKKHEMHFYRK
jgi:hypothetical protein